MKKVLALIISIVFMMNLNVFAIGEKEVITHSFSVVTYNVGGLPIVGSSSAVKSKNIAKYLSQFDIINIQENFTYNSVIRRNRDSRIQSKTKHIYGFVGIDSFSSFPISNVGYNKWDKSYGGILNDGGADIYANKGIRYYTVTLPDGNEIDIYNHHTDAGGKDTAEDKNLEARRSNLTQLANAIYERSVSKNRAVIVMGDSNSRYTRRYDDLKNILVDKCGLTDVWIELIRNGDYPEKGSNALTIDGLDSTMQSTENPNVEKVDKIMYCNGEGVNLKAVKYTDQSLTDPEFGSYSDHNPISVTFEY